MAKVWKILALLLVVTALVWLTTLWHWQTSRRDPSASDLALNLGVLPLVLTAGLLLTIVAITRLRSYAVAPALPARTAVASPAAPAQTAASERAAWVRVMASVVQLRTGSSWRSAQTSIAEGQCKPELNPLFKDDDGVSVFTAAMPDLATDAVADAIAELVAPLSQAQPDAWANYEAPGDMLRSLALTQLALASVQEAVEAQWPALSAQPALARNKPAALPSVSLRVGIPAHWSAPSQQLATAWLTRLFDPLVESGLRAAGQSRAMARSARPAVQLHVHPVANAEAFWLLTDQQLVQWERNQEAGLLFVLAADSLLSSEHIDEMSAAQQLFSGSNPRGRVPGEGAAALLLASSGWPQVADAEAPCAHLYRPNVLRRDKSADASGRVSPQVLLQAATDAVHASGWAAAQIEHITTDADQRSSRTGEVYGALQELLPHIDTGEQAVRLGAGCGDLGITRLLACVGLAANQARESQTAGLVLGAIPAIERFAVVVTPPIAPPPLAPFAAAAPAPAA